MEKVTTYKKVASHEAEKGTFNTCLLLYSGGLDTSVMLKWIQQEYDCDVIALTINIGQTADNLDAIKEKALKLGAKDVIVYDAKEEFAELCTEAVKANADYQGGYALGCPLGRVMISQLAVQFASEFGCEVIAHGCTGKGNDQVRFESYITTLNPELKIIAPVREWGMGREEEIAYAKENGIPVDQSKKSPYSYDENMWANTGEGGEIENPELIPPLENILKWANTPKNAPDEEELVEIEFKNGEPISLNGIQHETKDLIQTLNEIGGKHAVGVFHLIEDRVVGLKVRGVYENPAAHILIQAHKNLEQLVSTREENELKTMMDQKWAYLVYGAKYFEPVVDNIRAYINEQNKKVTGKVTVRLYKGNCDVVALSSPYSLFDENLATFNKSAAFNQNASSGFIELWNLPQKTAYQLKKTVKDEVVE
ncbi:argininosuccinate synthase [Rhodohalobacter sulfatireducens]|uniref:Argininosuccinate synthase n=1 Tax=Rhodohalobacter sulfatireducens TaxID=2911366 RepID=A0ABS9KHE4_9BACT|nr:argininosuccinate synthase [Rhodohalobacter sulfatireducens]MCG2590276.1 argininosuccinate synthase [Rhodohalobacter sulfatireducens]